MQNNSRIPIAVGLQFSYRSGQKEWHYERINPPTFN